MRARTGPDVENGEQLDGEALGPERSGMTRTNPYLREWREKKVTVHPFANP